MLVLNVGTYLPGYTGSKASVLSEGTVWPSYVVFVIHSPTPNSDEVEILSHCPEFGY
jgi:hypothetical protein